MPKTRMDTFYGSTESMNVLYVNIKEIHTRGKQDQSGNNRLGIWEEMGEEELWDPHKVETVLGGRKRKYVVCKLCEMWFYMAKTCWQQ
jgi:hypothetical protein